jgi:chromosome partitioning protein
MKVISIASQKGGVGKSTTAICISTALVKKGFKVLGLDFDGQGHFTKGLGIPPDEVDFTVAQWLLGRKPFDRVVKVGNGVQLLPSTKELEAETDTIQKTGSFPNTLVKMLGTLDPSQYDFVIIDCPPALGTMQKVAFVASHYFLVPLQPEFFSYEGLNDIINFANDVKEVNRGLKFAGVFAWKYNPNQPGNHKQKIVADVKKELGPKFFDTFIRSNDVISDSQEQGVNIYDFAPRSNGALDYEALTNELLEKIK